MEFTTQKELYKALLPVFQVKKRLASITKYHMITKEDIYKYLAINKWRFCDNLTIAQIVNDIIMINLKEIADFLGGENEKR